MQTSIAGFVALLRVALIVLSMLFCLQVYDGMMVSRSVDWQLAMLMLIVSATAIVCLLGWTLGSVRRWLLLRAGHHPLAANWWAGWCDVLLSPLILAAIYLIHPVSAALALSAFFVVFLISYFRRAEEGSRWMSRHARYGSGLIVLIGMGLIGAWQVSRVEVSPGMAFVVAILASWLWMIGLFRWRRPYEDGVDPGVF